MGQSVNHPTSLGEITTFVLYTQREQVNLPGCFSLNASKFDRRDSDLIVISGNGSRAFIRAYFDQAAKPDLVTTDGDRMDGKYVSMCSGLSRLMVEALSSVNG